MRRALPFTLDLLIVIAGAVILFVLISGGGVYDVAGTDVRLRSVGNPLVVLAVLLATRYACRRAAPFLGVRRWPTHDIDRRTLATLLGVHRGAHAIRRLTRTVVAVAVVALALKLIFAGSSPGFYNGDDVEVHEMTIGAMTHADWPIWTLRSAVFPMTVIYPPQRAIRAAGVTSIGATVFVGRASVAILSTASILLLWYAGRFLFDSQPGYALLAVLLFASNKLHISFGSSELPRPVATAFLVAAFLVLLTRRTAAGACLGGALLGVAASLRFGEAGFLAAAWFQLALERRWSHLVACAASSLLAAAAVLGVADALYWGRPFASLINIVDFTLVKRASSSGPLEPVWWYLEFASQWTTWPVLALAVVGTRRDMLPAAVWAWLPILILSALPHKEARYVIPAMPFVALLAANGVRAILTRWSVTAPGWHAAPVALVLALALGLVHDAGGWRLRRSNRDVELARRLAARPEVRQGLAAEQLWRLGGHLYLGEVQPLIDLNPAMIREAGFLDSIPGRVRSLALDARTAADPAVADRLARAGYRVTIAASRDEGYVLLTR